MSDHTKQQKFIEAAVTNEAHPVYKIGWGRSPILQHYALNVMQLRYMTPEKWFETASLDWRERIDKAIALCEAGEQEEQAKVQAEQARTDEMAALKAEVAALKAQMSKAESLDDDDEEKDEQEEAKPEPVAT